MWRGLQAVRPPARLKQYLMVPTTEFQGESSDTADWERKIEFLAGYLLARPYPRGDLQVVDGHTPEVVGRLVDDYYRAVSLDLVARSMEGTVAAPEDTGTPTSARMIRTHCTQSS